MNTTYYKSCIHCKSLISETNPSFDGGMCNDCTNVINEFLGTDKNFDRSTTRFNIIPLPEDLTETKTLRKETLVVNLFAGPGCGKSTLAAGIFSELKWKGVECELALEYCKDLVWEQREKTFEDQIYIFGKQHHRIHRLLGQVDVIITDSPILLTPIYDGEKRLTLKQLVIEEHNKMWTYNILLKRIKPYNPNGRLHDKNQAKNLDREIASLLLDNDIPFEVFDGAPESIDLIVRKIQMLLKWKKDNEK